MYPQVAVAEVGPEVSTAVDGLRAVSHWVCCQQVDREEEGFGVLLPLVGGRCLPLFFGVAPADTALGSFENNQGRAFLVTSQVEKGVGETVSASTIDNLGF